MWERQSSGDIKPSKDTHIVLDECPVWYNYILTLHSDIMLDKHISTPMYFSGLKPKQNS